LMVISTVKIMVIDSVQFGQLRRIVGGIIRGCCCGCLLVASSRRAVDGIKHVQTIGAIVIVVVVVVVLGASVGASWSTSMSMIHCICICCVPCPCLRASSLPIMRIPGRLSAIIQSWIRGCGRNVMLMLW
jgi:hypothetical protein